MKHLMAIARLECVSAVRLRWVRLLTAAMALLVIASAYAAGGAEELGAADGFARTTLTLVPVVLVLLPLAALVLGVSGQAVEPGSDPYLFTQPLSRAVIVTGRWAGQAAALGGATVAGLAAGGAVVANAAGFEGVTRFAWFSLASVALALVFLAMAAAIAAATERRVTALGVATFSWFLFVLLYDGVALGLAAWLTGPTGGRVLLGSVFGNPVDLVRILMLSLAGTPNVLGAAGDAWVRFLGGTMAATGLALGALAVWMLAPLAMAVGLMHSRDL